MPENKTISPVLMDRSEPLGNSIDGLGRRALHVLPISGSLPIVYQSFTVSYPSSTVEIWSFHSGNTSSPVVATMTLTYTDSTKTQIVSGQTVLL